MDQYPVLEIVPALKKALASNPSVIVQAPPGAGKSTVLPLQLLHESWLGQKKIIMLEPRRLAAKAVASRMADLTDGKVGGLVGYRIRFETRVSDETRVEVITEGILTRIIQSDSSLENTGLIIFDEFHERSLHADLALALSLQIQNVLRPDLKILLMSATFDGQQLSSFLHGAPIITSAGKQFPVDIKYSAQESDSPIAVRMSAAIRKALREEPGDVLAFFPGTGEIRRTQQLIEQEPLAATLHPLFGDLPFSQQQEALLPATNGIRKVVLATSIAETSLTIEGVSIVVDSGLSRVPRFDPRSGLTRLDTIRVTRDAADQRAGRAGRLKSGTCYRLWTEGVHRNLVAQRKPEILEADLATLLLEAFQWGIKDIMDLEWVTPPPAGAISQAKELLFQLEALDDTGITSKGKEMLQWHTHPRISHMLLMAITERQRALAADVAALLEERDPLKKEAGADINLRVEELRKWRRNEKYFGEKNIYERIERLASHWRKKLKTSVDNSHPTIHETGRLLIEAYPERLAKQQGKHSSYFTLSNGRLAKLPDHDPLIHESWLCITELDAGQKEGKIFSAAPVDEHDLDSMAKIEEKISWDEVRGMVTAMWVKRVGGLILESKLSTHLPEEEKNKVILEVLREKGLKLFQWSEDFISFQDRLLCLRLWHPEAGWPDVTDEHLLETAESWLTPYLNSLYKLSELSKLDGKVILTSMLSWEQQRKMDSLVPENILVPSGSSIHVNYFADGRPPFMEVRLQEMFGLAETPKVDEGRVKILLHLLSPGYKPVQVTQDLKSFWQTTYHEVRKELRLRYPKHSWPEDPWTAQAIRGARRRTSS